MREILFRGKRIYDGKWVEGVAFPHDNHGAVTIFRQNQSDGALEGFKVIPETVGQYTGLTDKNGNKIFEGDIVSTGNSDDYLGVVEWEKDNAGLAVSFDGLFEKFEEINFVDKVKLEVIGTIHDDSDLLEVSE